MKLKKPVKKAISVGVALSMIAGIFTFGPYAPRADAQQASGNAPFINSWLVAGPYDSAVADEIYGTVIPENRNVAPTAKITASSATFASNPPAFVADGSSRNQWVTENDNAPWLNFKWETPIKIGAVTIAQWGDGRHVNQYYHLTFKYDDGTTSDTIRVDSTSGDASKPTIFTPSTTLQNVVEMKVEIDKGRSPYPSITGVSELEVYESSLSDPSSVDRPIDGNWARTAAATSSSTWKTGPDAFPGGTDSASKLPKFAIDGDKNTEWISQMHDTGGAPSSWPNWDPTPTLYLTWKQPVKVKKIEVFDRHNTAWPANTSDVQKVNYTLKGANNEVLGTGTITNIDPLGKNPGVVTLEQAVSNVSKVELLIVHDGQKNLKNVGLGFTEVNVFDGDGIVEIVDPEPTAHITPKIGEVLTSGKGNQNWEYFDDRIWNRNYDDYQDLYGYYTVKKGIDTQNKFVFANTYVYSPNAQNAQFRFGSSGVNRLFVNDIAVTKPSVAAEVQKDMTIANIKLKAGWNKILLQIKHSFTEDLNANGVPIAQDANVSYLGFYGRVTDTNGNKIDNLTYSVTGESETLSIATQGLSANDVAQDKKLPTNILPKGYTEWPYVWNKSNYTAKHGLAASAFQFMANGGEPGYVWTIADGALPDGLTLKTDGTVDGFVNAAVGTYSFTVKVTDSTNAIATKVFEIEVKERPNKWFEEGRVSALSHTGPIYNWFVDPNYSIDLWAQRAKAQGHSLVSVEALQQNYYWPSKFADPKHSRNLYMPKDENGKVKDGLKAFEESVKRYGIKFGLYYATEGGGLQHYSTDVFVQNVKDLILRYDPAYLYFDGPQAMPNANYDVMYSNVRNYSNDIIINANAWTEEYGDPDLRTTESSHIFAGGGGSNLTKRTIAEPWKSVHTLNNYTPYYAKRDDYRQVTKEMIMNAGRGFVDNNDQMPIMSRGPNWDSPENIATRYPKSLQEFIDVREGLAAWFAPEGKPERHESTTGTMPYFLDGFGYTDDGKGNIAKFESGKGPDWGYAMSRDNNIYLHLIEGPDGKKGFSGNSLTISPVKDTVTHISWLNEDESLSFTQTGESVTIDLTGVSRDPVDTIVKLVTDKQERKYKLTNLITTGQQVTPDTLQVNVEGYMTYPALKVRFEQGKLTFNSNQPNIASVDAGGVVQAIADGTAAITVNGIYDGVEQSSVLNVTVKDGKVYVKDTMIGASLWIGDREAYGEFASYDQMDYTLEGRSLQGGAIGLHAATITMKSGIVNLKGGTVYEPISITETDIVNFANGKVVPKPVSELTRAVIWAEVELDGKIVTSNRVFMDLQPFGNVAKGAEITASTSQGIFTPDKVIDGKLIEGASTDSSKWSVPGNAQSWIAFKLQHEANIKNVAVNFNTLNQSYYNTPKKMDIQISEDGANWQTVSTVTPPTGGAYFGFSTVYAVEGISKYVRLLFPNGSNSANLDLLEVAINGIAIEEPVLVEKGALSDLITNAELTYTKESDYTADTWAALQVALAAAKVMVTDVSATQVQVDEAATALSEAMAAMKAVEVGSYILTATGDASVIAGESFDVTYTLSNVAEFVYALDQTIHYDPSQVEFLSVDALQSGFSIVGKKEGEGEIRILMASEGSGSAIKHTSPVLKMNFKAKAASQNVTSSIFLTDVSVAGATGIETPVNNGSAYTIQIIVVDKAALQALVTNAKASHDAAVEGAGIGQYPVGSKAILQAEIDHAKAVAGQGGATQQQVDQAITQLQAALEAFNASVNVAADGDLNADGKFSIGDLALVAAGYGKTSADADWAMYEKADVKKDGKIDIEDLAAIARLILG